MPIYQCHDSDFLITDIADYESKDNFKLKYLKNKSARGLKDTLLIESPDSKENNSRNHLPSGNLSKRLYENNNLRSSHDDSFSSKNVEIQDELTTCSNHSITSNSIYFDFDVGNDFIITNPNQEHLSFTRISDHEKSRAGAEKETCIDANEATKSEAKSNDYDENSSYATMSTDFSNISDLMSRAETYTSTQTQATSGNNKNKKRIWRRWYLKLKNITDEVMNGLALELEAKNTVFEVTLTENNSPSSYNDRNNIITVDGKQRQSYHRDLNHSQRLNSEDKNNSVFGRQA